MTDDEPYEMKCRCGMPNCRGTITGFDWLKPESEQLQEFAALEGNLDWHGQRVGEWVAYMGAPPAAVLIVGASLLWALRGFRQPP